MTSDEDKDLSTFINDVVADAALVVEKNRSASTQISNKGFEDRIKDQNLPGHSTRSYESNASFASHGESRKNRKSNTSWVQI